MIIFYLHKEHNYWNPEIRDDFDVDDFTLYHRLGRNEIHDEEIKELNII